MKKIIKNLFIQKKINVERKYEEMLNLKDIYPKYSIPLTKEEKEKVILLWGDIIDVSSYKEFEVYKYFNGFNEKFLSHNIYLPLVARKLNDYKYTKIFENKSILGSLKLKTSESLLLPKTFIRRINNEYYDCDFHQISELEAIDICISEKVLIVKDSIDSSGGKSVSKLLLSELNNNEKYEMIKNLFSERSSDFIVQEYVKQSAVMSQFNDSSINTFRISTLYLNGKVSLCNIVLRYGKAGMNLDNWGAGGIICGISPNGILHSSGYDIKMNKYTDCNGVKLSNFSFDFIPDVVARVLQAHKDCFPLCKFIGWDICIGENGIPIIIEINSSQPGIFGEQLCNGPIFGDRTNEVINYIRNKPFVYNKALLEY